MGGDDRVGALRAATTLPNLGAYRDYLTMLGHLSTHLGRLFVLTDAVDEATRARMRGFPRLTFIPLGRRRFPQRCAAWLGAQVEGPGLHIAHDLLGHLGLFFEAYARHPRRPRFINTQLTSNWAWFQRVRRIDTSFGAHYASQRLLSLHKDRRVSRLVDLTWVLGPGHERDLIEGHGMDPARIYWAPAETDTRFFHPGGPPRPVHAAPRLLFTGAVWRNKGIALLFDAVEALSARWPELRLALLGRVLPWERPWLERQLQRRGVGDRVETPGSVSREALRARYRAADLYVFPSHFEGSPRTLREAIACGCPAVASDIPGHRGVDPEGAFIRFAPVGDRPGWIEAITAALEEPFEARAERVERGVAHLQSIHHPATVAAGLFERYRSLVE